MRCDETRPRCKRCATHGVPCPGYRTDQPGGVEFKDQTSITVQRAKEHYRTKESAASVKAKSSSPQDSMFSTPAADAVTLWIGQEPVEKMITRIFPDNLLSPVVVRQQLYGNFMDIWLPRDAPLDHEGFFQMIASSPTESPALLESLDALSLVTVGSANKDRAILNESLKMYGRALGSLATAISRPDAAQNDDLLAAVTVLATCALYDEIGQYKSGWVEHVRGCQQLIEARGPESLQSDLSLLILSNMRHGSLCASLIMRKAPMMARPDWRAVSLRSPVHDSSTTFYDSAVQIPGLLERQDQLVKDFRTTAADVDELLLECDRIETELRDWFADWQLRSLLEDKITTFPRGILYGERPIDDFPTFTSLCSDRTFPIAFIFPTFPIAYLVSLYWVCMHFLRTTVQTLHNLRHALDEDWYPEASRIVPDEELLTYAFNLCKCMPFFCEPVSSNTGQIGIFLPMRTAAIYFTTHGQWKYAKWIGAVRNSVFTKGLSPPNVKDPPGLLSAAKKAQLVGDGPDWMKAFWECNQVHQSPSGFSSRSSSVGSYS